MGEITKAVVLALIALSYYIGYTFGVGNLKPTYGDSGLPKNCRAIIGTNVSGYQEGRFTADEALKSIDRNCGFFGYSWSNR